MAEFAPAAGFPDCWCSCKADRHRLELSDGKLVHTRCKGCRCAQYDPREDLAGDVAESAPIPQPIPDTAPLADLPERVSDGAPVPLPPVPEAAYPPDAMPLPLPLGEVLGWWQSYRCESCGSRRFEPFDCHETAAEPVTLTMTKGHGVAAERVEEIHEVAR